MKIFGGKNRKIKTIGKNTTKWIKEKQADKREWEKPEKKA
jgi:hypothetical protein